jgi:hypothetical protein
VACKSGTKGEPVDLCTILCPPSDTNTGTQPAEAVLPNTTQCTIPAGQCTPHALCAQGELIYVPVLSPSDIQTIATIATI